MCVHPYIKKIDGNLNLLPCGKCVECLKSYSRDWDFRLKQELKIRKCWYITLTYNDEYLPEYTELGVRHSAVIKSEVQNFMKRLRKLLHHPEIKYFAVGEYGGKRNRAHYHILLFTNFFHNVHQAYVSVLQSWSPRGFVYVKLADSNRHFHYLTKYVNKLDKRHHSSPPFKLMSKSLGLSFLSPNMREYFLTTFSRKVYNSNGHLISLPRYYVKKLNERFDKFGLNWSQYGQLLNSKSLMNVGTPECARFYHVYFIQNYEEIESCFIDSELKSNHITKFLTPSPNIVFDWYLHQNKATKDQLLWSSEILDNVALKEHSMDYYQDVGCDCILFENDDYD